MAAIPSTAGLRTINVIFNVFFVNLLSAQQQLSNIQTLLTWLYNHIEEDRHETRHNAKLWAIYVWRVAVAVTMVLLFFSSLHYREFVSKNDLQSDFDVGQKFDAQRKAIKADRERVGKTKETFTLFTSICGQEASIHKTQLQFQSSHGDGIMLSYISSIFCVVQIKLAQRELSAHFTMAIANATNV